MSGRRVVITGRGVVSPLGCDWASFAEAVRSGRRAAVGSFPGASSEDPVPAHVLPEVESKPREGDPLSTIAIAAVRSAFAEAGVELGGEPLDDVGLVMNTVLGPSTATEAYLERLRSSGPRASRPAQFVDTLLSMPASRVGIALRLRGSTAVLGGASAVELAFDWVRHGREDTVVAGGGEFYSPKCLRYHRELARRSGVLRAALCQGAAFVVLEAAERAQRPLAEVLGSGGASEPQEVAVPWSSDRKGRCFGDAMREALADAGLAPNDVTAIALAAGDDASEASEVAAITSVFSEGPPRLFRPKRLLGEGLGGSAGLSLLATLALLEGEGPRVVLVNSFEMGGGTTSLAVRV